MKHFLSCTNKPQTLKKKEKKTHRKRILFHTFTPLTACSQLKLYVGSNSNQLMYMWEKTPQNKTLHAHFGRRKVPDLITEQFVYHTQAKH